MCAFMCGTPSKKPKLNYHSTYQIQQGWDCHAHARVACWYSVVSQKYVIELEAHNNFNSVVPGLEQIQTVDLQV